MISIYKLDICVYVCVVNTCTVTVYRYKSLTGKHNIVITMLFSNIIIVSANNFASKECLCIYFHYKDSVHTNYMIQLISLCLIEMDILTRCVTM